MWGNKMLYENISLIMPDEPRYELNKKSDDLIYVKYRISSSRVNGKLKHKRLLIGKLSSEQEGDLKIFHPNTNYYEFFKKPLPSNAIVKGPGRPKNEVSTVTIKPKNMGYTSFGYTLACHAIARECGLDSMLKNSFGESMANKILAAAAFFAAGTPGGLSNIDHFTSKHMCFTNKPITSQRLSELYLDLTPIMGNDFFRQWIGHCCKGDCVCYDVTSISNYSTSMPMVAWGYNRDKEKLPQINVGMFCTIKSKLPVFFSSYNGSINDFTNLPYVLGQAKNNGLILDTPLTLVLDGGFAVKASLEEARRYGCEFIVGAPLDFCNNIRDEVLNWRRSPSYDNNSQLIVHRNETIRCKTQDFEIGRIKTKLMMYKSPKASARDEAALSSYVAKMAEELSTVNHLGTHKVKQYSQFFNISQGEDGLSFELKEHYLSELLELCGCFALFSTRSDFGPESVLEIYREKDCVEKIFGLLKNDILDERLEVKNQDSIYGKLFIAFIALIIRKLLDNKLRSYLTKSRIGLDSAIERLADIQCTKKDQIWILTSALTKQQKELVEELKLPINYLDIPIHQGTT